MSTKFAVGFLAAGAATPYQGFELRELRILGISTAYGSWTLLVAQAGMLLDPATKIGFHFPLAARIRTELLGPQHVQQLGLRDRAVAVLHQVGQHL